MTLSRQPGSPSFTRKQHAQSGLAAQRPPATQRSVGNQYWATDQQVLTTCQLVAGVPTWVAPAITALTGDVTTAAGTGSVAATVEGLQGNPVDAAVPGLNDVLTWDGAKWAPAAPAAGASIVAPSATALLWTLSEAASPFAQSNKPLTSLDMTLTGAGEMSFAAPLGDGVWLPSGGVTLVTADTAEGEAADWTWHWWGYGGAQSSDFCGVAKVAVAGLALAIALQADGGGAPAVLFHRHGGQTTPYFINELRVKRALMDGAWHHVAISFDGSVDLKFRIYVDGSLVWTSGAQSDVVDWGNHCGYYVPGTYGIQRITLEPTVLTLAAIREIATRGLGWAQP